MNCLSAPWRRLSRTIICPIYFCTIALWACWLLQGCQQEPDNPTTNPVTYDIVRYDGVSATEGTLSFSLYPADGSGRMLLYATAGTKLPSLNPGQFAMIGYTCKDSKRPSYDYPTHIEITGYNKITTFSIKKTQPSGISGWDSDPIGLTAAWQAGTYLLLRADLPASEGKRTMGLLFDETALDGDVIDAYFYHRRPSIHPAIPTTFYAAYDLQPVWEETEASAIRLHFSVADNLMAPSPEIREKCIVIPRP